MAISMDQLRAALAAKNAKKGGTGDGAEGGGGGGNPALYKHWDIPMDATAVLRFLPDANEENPFFWIEQHLMTLPFNGIVGGEYPTEEPVEVKFNTIESWKGAGPCPIRMFTKPWWAKTAPADQKALAKMYWRKVNFLMQGFVVTSPFVEENPPANPIREFVLSKQISDKIEPALMDPEFQCNPTDILGGNDFKIIKTKSGEYNSYQTSTWAKNARSLTDAEQAALEAYPLIDLTTRLGPKPDAEMLKIHMEMFHASLNGEPFDYDRFSPYGFRAYKKKGGTAAAAPAPSAAQHTGYSARPAAASVAAPVTAPVTAPAAPVAAPVAVEQVVAPAAVSAPVATATPRADPKAIMEQIRARQAAAEAAKLAAAAA